MFQNYTLTQQPQPFVQSYMYSLNQPQLICPTTYVGYNQCLPQQNYLNSYNYYQSHAFPNPQIKFQQQAQQNLEYRQQQYLFEEFMPSDDSKDLVDFQRKKSFFETANNINENLYFRGNCQSTDSSSNQFGNYYNEIRELYEGENDSKKHYRQNRTASYSSNKNSARGQVQLIQSIGQQVVDIKNKALEKKEQGVFLKQNLNCITHENGKSDENLQQSLGYLNERIQQSGLKNQQKQIQEKQYQKIERNQNNELKISNKEFFANQPQHMDQNNQNISSSEDFKQPNSYLYDKTLIFYENLKNEMKKLYPGLNDKDLVSFIEEDLKQSYLKQENNHNKQLPLGNIEDANQKQQEDYLLYQKCIFLNFESEMHKYFNKYSQGILCNSPYSLSSIGQQRDQEIDDQMQIEDQQLQLNEKNLNNKQEEVINYNYCNNNDNNSKNNQEIQNQDQEFVNKLNSPVNKYFFNIQPKSKVFLKNFDFSDVRQNQIKNQKKIKEKKLNSSYIKNSQYHNLNKLFMYNILSMFRNDSLNNLNIPSILVQELTKIILELKLSSRRDYQNPSRGFFDYFSHSHYKVLFLKINSQNLQQLKENPQEVELHQRCFNIDFTKEISEAELTYMNVIKEINYNLFLVNIREEQLFDDGSNSKQNIRRKYTQKAINGIKKLAQGISIKRF